MSRNGGRLWKVNREIRERRGGALNRGIRVCGKEVLTEGREGREAGRRADEENYFPPDDLIFSPRRHMEAQRLENWGKEPAIRSPEFNTSDFPELSPPGGPEGGFWLQIVPSPILPRFFHFQIVPSRIF